jgi:inosine/xanthosine triphosphate pyrophosphatase family protein
MQALGPQKLHHMLDGFEDKSAQAVCTFAYCEGPGHEPVLFQGRTDGKLVASRGSTVFGKCNPNFEYPEVECLTGWAYADNLGIRLGFVLRVRGPDVCRDG